MFQYQKSVDNKPTLRKKILWNDICIDVIMSIVHVLDIQSNFPKTIHAV